MIRDTHPSSNEILRHLATFAGPRKWSFVGSCVLGILTGLADIVGVAAIVYLLFSVASGRSQVSGDGILEYLFAQLDQVSELGPPAVVLLIVAMVLIRGAVNFAYMHVARSMVLDTERSIRTTLLDRYLSDGIDDFARKNTGSIINNIQIEATHVADFLYFISRVFVSISYLVVVFLVILGTSWKMSAAIVLGALFHGALLKVMNAKARRMGQAVLAHREKIATHTTSTIRAFKSIKVSAAERQMVEKLDDLSKSYSRSMFQLGKTEVVTSSLAELALFGILGLTLVVATVTGLHMASTIGIVALMWKVRPNLGELESSLFNISANLASLRSVENELTAQSSADSPDLGHRQFTSLPEQGHVEFDNVGFRYSRSKHNALSRVSFIIPQGSTCAVIGKSGAGKTTLVNLLLKLAAPQEGRILIGGEDLKDIEKTYWLSVASAAGQDLEMTDGTLRANLTLGLTDVEDSAILDALAIAEATNIVKHIPGELDANLSTSGLSLSGGQRQRLVLARALLRRPRLLILDESTNAVDSKTETKVLANIRKAFPGITLMIIAHRSSITEHVDYVVALEDGQVKEVGVPDIRAAIAGSSAMQYARSETARARVSG